MATANHVLLRRITVTSAVSSITFDSIPQTGYTDLKVVISARTTATGNAWQGLYMNLNGSSSSFAYRNLYAVPNNSPYSNAGSGNLQGWVDGASATSSTFGNTEIYIPNAFGSTYKSISTDTVMETNAAANLLGMNASLWSNNAAITSIAFTPESGSFAEGSSFSLYGIANANTTPTTSPKAFGGDIIKTDGTYWYHAFLSTGTFKPQLNLTCDVLQVAGGGSAGSNQRGGGGGAGGLLTFTSQAFASGTNYVATVGAGGAATANTGIKGNNGSNSQLGSLTASVGGGGGASGGGSDANTGGSGGGVSYYNYTGAAGTSGQGYKGGNTTNSWPVSSGGGGAGGAGGDARSSVLGGVGGVGATSAMLTAMGSATSTGQNVSGSYYYAGGGGGGGDGNYTAAGGYGGGGDGQAPPGKDGTLGTGGGGGGGSYYSPSFGSGGAGGSGIIIIRYPV